MPEIGEISEYASGVDLVVEWQIAGFFSLPQKDGPWYYSPKFSFGGKNWYLSIRPKGSSERSTFGHVDLRLWKYSYGPSTRQAFSLSLKTVKGEKYEEEHFTKNFKKRFSCHEILRFIKRSELSSRLSELVPGGVLTVICTMKNTTSAVRSGNTAIAYAFCHHCKWYFEVKNLSSHKKKCMHRLIKCPDCLEVVVLQKWLDEHECQQERPKALKGLEQNFENSSVEACTQTGEENGEARVSGSSTSPHEKKVMEDLKKLFLNKEDCDVIIKVKGSEFPAHRIIIKARSPIFESTFLHDMQENVTGVVEIVDCDPSPFSDFLYFLYCGDIGMISRENVISLFTLADKYEVLDLRAKCLDFIKKNMTIGTFCETITLALQHSETELIALATDFFVKHAEEILLTVKWQTFAAENPTQSNELFIKFVRSVKH